MNLSPAELSQFRRRLLAWFRQGKRDLPWRRTRDPYRIWLSETMLQQTRVAAVIPYFERFVARFPTMGSLASARTDDVLRLWAGLGYYSRARNLRLAALDIVVKHNGQFPRRPDAALSLPGVGRYTAAAVLSIAYEQPLAVLDGNVARVIARLRAIRGNLREPKLWTNLQHHAGELLASSAPGDWNQAMMELGATICTPRSPRCDECPVGRWCTARRLGLVEEIPAKRAKRPPVKIQIAAAVLLDPRGRTLLVKSTSRKANGCQENSAAGAALFSHLWSFPSVPVHRNACAELAQHLREAFGIVTNAPVGLQPLSEARHSVTFRAITLKPFLLRLENLPRVTESRRPLLAQLSGCPISNATRKIAAAAVANESAVAAR